MDLTKYPTLEQLLQMPDEALPHVPSQIVSLHLYEAERMLEQALENDGDDVSCLFAVCSFLQYEWDRY